MNYLTVSGRGRRLSEMMVRSLEFSTSVRSNLRWKIRLGLAALTPRSQRQGERMAFDLAGFSVRYRIMLFLLLRRRSRREVGRRRWLQMRGYQEMFPCGCVPTPYRMIQKMELRECWDACERAHVLGDRSKPPHTARVLVEFDVAELELWVDIAVGPKSIYGFGDAR